MGTIVPHVVPSKKGYSMIYGTGIDIVDISRFERFLAEGKDALFQRLFTQREIEYCQSRKRSAQHYALRFAVKEAFFKASGLGLRDGMSWKDVEVVNNVLGKPELELHGRAADIFTELQLKKSHASLSHEGTYGVAMVILEQ
jgi:holo-[acyl-carrier protein] synthase